MQTDTWAEVRANGTVIRYQRWRAGAVGTKGSVVVIGPRLDVMVPDLAEPSCLGPFIEGLGTRGLTILAGGPYYEAALALAELDPERVTHVSPLGG